MHCLQIFHLQALQIPLRCPDTAVAEDFREVEEIPASTEIVHRECVPQGVRGATNTADAELAAELRKVAQGITGTEQCAVLCREHQAGMVAKMIQRFLPPAKKDLAKFKRHGHEAVPPTLAFDLNN